MTSGRSVARTSHPREERASLRDGRRRGDRVNAVLQKRVEEWGANIRREADTATEFYDSGAAMGGDSRLSGADVSEI